MRELGSSVPSMTYRTRVNDSSGRDADSNNKSELKIRELVVGAWRFELQTSCAQGRRATRLRYAPTCECIVDSKVGLDIRSSYIHRAGAVSRTNCTRHDEMTPVLSFYVVARSTQGAERREG